MRRARRERAAYVGAWLPEPVIDAPDALPATDVTHAMMVAMERLSPLERAAFLLHDIFETDHATIAATLGRDVATCRQLASRARTHLRTARPRYPVSRDDAERLTRAFLHASRQGDVGALGAMLAEDVVFVSDGGGRRWAALNPLIGPARVMALFAGLARRRDRAIPGTIRFGWLDGLPGYLSLEPDDGLPQSTALRVETIVGAARITAIYVMRNPDKLRHLPHLSSEGQGEDRADGRTEGTHGRRSDRRP